MPSTTSRILGSTPGRPSGFRGYAIVSVGQAVSLLGSGLTSFAVGVWVFQHTDSVSMYLLVGFFSRFPSLLASPMVGTIVDRVDRRVAIIVADLGAGVGTFLLALLFLFDRVDLWQICTVVALQSALGATQFPAFSALTAQMVSTEELSRASGLRELVRSSSFLLAPLVAGSLLNLIGIGWIMLLDFVTILPAIASLLWVDVGGRSREERRKAASRRRTSFWQETREGWHYVKGRRGLVGLLLLFAVVNYLSIGVQTLLTPLILGFASAQVLGVVLTTAGVGLLAGSGLMSLWAGPRRRVVAILFLLGVQGLTLVMGALREDVVLITAAAFVYISAQPVVKTCSQAIWLRKVEPAVQGRVFAIRQMIVGSTMPLAYLTMGPLADHVFEPLMAPDGALAATVGPLIGTGPGRGIALMFGIMGFLTIGIAFVASGYRALKNLEEEVPDAVGGST